MSPEFHVVQALKQYLHTHTHTPLHTYTASCFVGHMFKGYRIQPKPLPVAEAKGTILETNLNKLAYSIYQRIKSLQLHTDIHR